MLPESSRYILDDSSNLQHSQYNNFLSISFDFPCYIDAAVNFCSERSTFLDPDTQSKQPAMTEILTEQIEALKETKYHDKKKQTSSTGENEKDTRQKLPKGVVLDKDGKPFVTFPSTPGQLQQMLTIYAPYVAVEHAHPPLNGVRSLE